MVYKCCVTGCRSNYDSTTKDGNKSEYVQVFSFLKLKPLQASGGYEKYQERISKLQKILVCV